MVYKYRHENEFKGNDGFGCFWKQGQYFTRENVWKLRCKWWKNRLSERVENSIVNIWILWLKLLLLLRRIYEKLFSYCADIKQVFTYIIIYTSNKWTEPSGEINPNIGISLNIHDLRYNCNIPTWKNEKLLSNHYMIILPLLQWILDEYNVYFFLSKYNELD